MFPLRKPVRLALEARALASGLAPQAGAARHISRRRSRTSGKHDRFVEKLGALPVLDARAPKEILDDLYDL